MPQLLLPIFPDAVTPIKGLLSVGKEDGRVVYTKRAHKLR